MKPLLANINGFKKGHRHYVYVLEDACGVGHVMSDGLLDKHKLNPQRTTMSACVTPYPTVFKMHS